MKVYYIGGSYDSCYYVRCLQPLIWNGWNGDRKSLRTSKVSPEQSAREALDADIVVYHRPIDRKHHLESAKLLKAAGKKIVFDNDDTYIKDSGVPTQMFGTLNDELKEKLGVLDEVLKEFAAMADMVTVSTEFLAEEYRSVNKNVVVLKNCIDPMDWPKPKRSDGGKVRIGIVGSAASNQDYKMIIPLLDILKDRDDVQLVLFALPAKKKGTEWAVKTFDPEFKFWEKYSPEHAPFCQIADYMDTLNNLKLDIMLIPRYDSYFNRAKSNLKFLEASMCETAVIAQAFGDGKSPYQVNPEDGEHMILCNNEDEWIKSTLELIENKEKRQSLAKGAREYVIKNYNIKDNARNWAEAYKTLWTTL